MENKEYSYNAGDYQIANDKVEFIMLEWMEELLETVGYQKTMESLKYYNDINLIDKNMRRNLEEHVNNISTDGHLFTEKRDADLHKRSVSYVQEIERIQSTE